MTELRVGVIGFGYMGRLHAEAYARVPGVCVTAIAESNIKAESTIPATARHYADYREMLASNVEALSICVPTHLNCQITLEALAAGKHVLLEKPIAVNLEEAGRMLEAARRAGKTLFVGMTHRFYPELREAKRLLDEGAIGPLVSCRDSILEHFGFLQSPPWYLDKRLAGGGTVLTSGIHLVDRLRWFTGQDITHVSGQAGNPYFGLSVEDAAQMHLRFRSGLTGQITFAWMREPHPLVCDLELVGTKGSLIVHTWKGYELHTAQGSTLKNFYDQEPHPQKVLVGVTSEVEEFLSNIRERRAPSPSAEESTEALKVVMAFYKATRSGQIESVEGGERMSYELLIQNAHVIDPAENWDGPADIGVAGGVVAAFGPNLEPNRLSRCSRCAWTVLSPGLIDLHGHWYEGGLYGINAELGLNHGVTTAVDAGTAGFANFPEFRRTVMDHSRANLLGFVHISCLGLHAPFAEELLNLAYARPAETAAVIERHRDRAVGVKVRIGAMTGEHGSAALKMAVEAAEKARVPLMVHISKGANEREVLDSLRPGDILTHCFHGRSNGMFAATAEGLIQQVKLARERGVWFDIGHGCGSFSWESAQKAFEHHFYPDTISTDLHRYCVEEPFCLTLPLVMSKFLCLGMSLNDVIAKTTLTPARALGREGQLGHLRPGAQADMLLFEVRNGEYQFLDTHLRSKTGTQLIEPRLVVRNGIPYEPGAFRVELRDLYECDQVVFDFVNNQA